MIELLIEQAVYAHWYIFGLFMLAGLNIPISEDVLIIGAGVLASTIVPDNLYYLVIFSYLGAYLSDIENYWLARYLGTKLLKINFFSKLINPKRIDTMQKYFNKYGALTFLLGRFIPFGVRNGLNMSAGLSKMRFIKFVIFDGIAAILTTAFLFSLGYIFGKNYKVLLQYVSEYKIYIFVIAILIIVIIYLIIKFKNKQKTSVI